MERLVHLAQPISSTTAASLLDLDPELAEGMPCDAAALARPRLAVAVQHLLRGEWRPGEIPSSRRSALGVLVLDGLISREVGIAGGGALELIGASDIVNPWAGGDTALLEIDTTWSVIAPTRIALLEPRTVVAMTAWPEVLEAVVLRAGRRATRLAVHQAISQLPRVEQRILTLLWYLAERWGRVTPGGIVLALPLSHTALGRLVGARRPTVSLAVKELLAQDLLGRRDDGSWLLAGEPPADLARVRGAHRRERAVELPSLDPPIAALADRLAALRGRYEQNLHVSRNVLERSAAVRETSRRLVTRPRPLEELAPRRRAARRG
jgi:CRP/FNR family transcriptional regulator, cyclic AMP receptor protein